MNKEYRLKSYLKYYPNKWVSLIRNELVIKECFPVFSLEDYATEKQKEVLKLAVINGYCDFPRKINLVNLASKIGIGTSTLSVHLQKIQGLTFKKLLTNYENSKN